MTGVEDEAPGWVSARLAGRRTGRAVAKVLHSLAIHPRQMSYASTAEAAALSEVNVATVVRTAQQLGFSGWPTLRAELRSRYLARLSASEVLSEHAGSPGEGPARATLRRELHNLHDLALLLDEDQIGRIGRIVHDARVGLVVGSGSFAAPGLQLAHLLQTIGHDIRLHLSSGTALLNAGAMLGPGDCLVVFQLWRTPYEVLNAIRVAAAAGVTVVLVSDQGGGEFAGLADELVAMPSEGASMFPSLVGAITVGQAIVAAVVAVDPSAAAAASDRSEQRWMEHGLFPDPSG